ncbi:MAG: DNA repair protein RecN, partial [Balneolaceae bacterium]
MIRELHIQNFALIDKLSVSFSEGLSILTGETGAGKSIILGALNMILGERADTDLIRQGADKAIAEAILWTGEHAVVEELLREAEIEVRSELILRREIRAAGSRAFINDTPVPVQLLKKVGDLLVDLHGQHEHQLLLREEEHREVVDRFKAVRGAKVAYVEAFEELSALKRELAAVRKREAQLKEKSELYRFQLKELSEAKLVEGEEEEMQAEMRLLDNAEDLQMKAGMISAIGTNEDGGLLELLGKMRGLLEDLADIEPRFEEYVAEMKSAKITLEDIVSFAENYRDQVEFDPQRLEFLRRRQSELQRLQKKYTRTHGELMEYEEFLKRELDAAMASDSRGEELEALIVEKTRVLRDAAVALHEARVRQGALFSAQIVERLAQLGIPHGTFEVEVEWLEDSAGWIEVGGAGASGGSDSGSGAFRVTCEPHGA